MRSVRAALRLVIVLSTVSVTLSAQPRPNFSGTWVEDPSARKTTFAAPPGAASTAIRAEDTGVTQTAATLTSEMKFMSQVVRHVYRLDGQESVNHNGANTLTTKSAWERQKL